MQQHLRGQWHESTCIPLCDNPGSFHLHTDGVGGSRQIHQQSAGVRSHAGSKGAKTMEVSGQQVGERQVVKYWAQLISQE
jgi:hypothetical protein